MKIAIGSDHAGFELKTALCQFLKSQGHSVLDLGVDSPEPADYPDVARKVSQSLLEKKAPRGILICGSGVGICIAANKVPGIRAALCHDLVCARQSVEDDDANILCLGGRIIKQQEAFQITSAWLAAHFSNAPRHVRRRDKIREIEQDYKGDASS